MEGLVGLKDGGGEAEEDWRLADPLRLSEK
jgi:hypothetical protein